MSITRILTGLSVAMVMLMLTACSGSNHFDAPTGLGVTAGTTPLIPAVLKWNLSSGAFGYNVYRGTASGGVASKTRIAQSVVTSSYSDTSARSNQTYFYQITAVNSTGETGGSNEVSIATSPVIGGTIQSAALTLTDVGSTVAGSAQSGSADGVGTAAGFNNPQAVTTDGRNLYIADTSNNSIRQVVIATGAVSTLAGTGSAGTSDGTGAAAAFNGPAGITTDGAKLYIADTANNMVRALDLTTGAVSTLAGSATSGSTDGTGAAASFNGPVGITTDGVYVYLADSGNNKIRKIVISTGEVTTLAGLGTAGSTDGTGTAALFNAPQGIVAIGTTFLYVADTGGNTIRAINISTKSVTTVVGSGQIGSSDATGTSASFSGPVGITTDGTSLFIADTGNNSIRIMDGSSAVTTIAVKDASGAAVTFSAPRGITTDGTSLYIADSGSNSIRKIQ